MTNTIHYTLFECGEQVEELLKEYAEQFPDNIRKRWKTQIKKNDMLKSILSKLLLYEALQESNIDATPQNWPMEYNSNGRPYIRDQDFDFNISHSKNLVACAINHEGSVGIDVQHLVNKTYFLRFGKAISNLVPEQKEMGLEDWTEAEAKLKCTGEGLGKLRELLLRKEKYHLKTLKLHPDYSCKVATKKKINIELYFISETDLIKALEKQISNYKNNQKNESTNISKTSRSITTSITNVVSKGDRIL